jgi:hypothetical protein
MGATSRLEFTDLKKRHHIYEWVNDIALNGTKDADQKNLSMIFFLLNLLAFFVHQIFELTDLHYQKCRAKFSARKEFWNQLRCTFRILLFKTWEQLLAFIICPPEPRPP